MTAPGVGRIRDRSAFRELRRPAGRAARGPVRAAFVPPPGGDAEPCPQVAYGVSRRVGNAVVRNRLRRRLRAAVREVAGGVPAGRYLLSADPGALDEGFPELVADVRSAMAAAGAAPAAKGPR